MEREKTRDEKLAEKVPLWIVNLFLIIALFYFSYTKGVDSGFIVKDWYFNLSYDFGSLKEDRERLTNFIFFAFSLFIGLELSVKFVKKIYL